MKKYFSKIVSLGVILPVSFATIFCCQFSLVKPVAASAVKTHDAMPACHAHKNKASAPMKSNCECCVSKRLQADQLTKNSFEISKVVTGYVFSNVFPSTISILKDKFNLAYLNGPPGPASDTPLYIHLRNIRL